MIFGKNARLMLKYQKAKAKLLEYKVSRKDYPQFTLNSSELSYPTTYILSRYSECIIENNTKELKELEPFLNLTAQYYDSAFNSEECYCYELDFLLSGASAYFLNNDFGSAKVLAKKASTRENKSNCPQKLLLKIYNYLLNNDCFSYLDEIDTFSKVNNYFLYYFEKGKNLDSLKEILYIYRKEIYKDNNMDNAFYVDILIAVIMVACNNSSWEILPQNSQISIEDWNIYLGKKTSIKMLWPAQRLIAEKGILYGENAIIQLPTGVGKTKSIEIIIRAAFLSGRATIIIIIAPLKALCNEITTDMYHSFESEVTVNLFSDILQDDFYLSKTKKQILICTPEKLSYILHHDSNFLNLIDLFIFDEGHMFDDGRRGVTYELLITHIKENKNDYQQLILLSAVLSNSEKIREWLFDDKGILVTSDKIVSTPKSIGFSSKQKNIHFFSDNKNEEDYFIPNILKIEKLNKLSKERKDRFFPDLDSSYDVAIYNAIKLCTNGGVAIYTSQQRSIKTIFKKLLDLNERNYDLSPLKTNTKTEEIAKLKSFIKDYYGENHYYTKACELGVLPHSSNIENGIKLAVEYALKNKYVFCIICTSTLAQGVNIPIKYLLVTNIRIGQNNIKIRDFQNLVGRIARSGVYTEGSVIITNSKIYDSRNIYKKQHLWDDYTNMFDKELSEPCSSSILSLVQNFKISYKNFIDGNWFIEQIIEHLDEKDFFATWSKRLNEKYIEKYPDETQNTIIAEVLLRRNIISHIENYLCLVYSNDVLKKDIFDICSNTLAYALATENERELLKRIFSKIKTNILKYSPEKLRKYSSTMSEIDLSVKIEKWIIENKIIEKIFLEEELLNLIIEFYLQLNPILKYTEQFYHICQLWLKGKTPFEIADETKIGISEIDNICKKEISYNLNFLIGNICDLLDDTVEENKLQTEQKKILILLQKKIKYGVPYLTSVSICEKIFNDRLLSIKLTQILHIENIEIYNIIHIIKYYEKEIFELLSNYPKYFENRLKFLLNKIQ